MAKNKKIKFISIKNNLIRKTTTGFLKLNNFFKKTDRLKGHLSLVKKKRHYWAAPISVLILMILLIGSFLVDRNDFDKTKQQLVQNPNDIKANLVLAQELLTNNQFEEAERILLIAQSQLDKQEQIEKEDEDLKGKIENLWLKKHYSDPQDIAKLINLWEKIVTNKPHYRDAFLQLAYLYYQDGKTQLAKQSLQQALEIDPNFELPKELRQAILP